MKYLNIKHKVLFSTTLLSLIALLIFLYFKSPFIRGCMEARNDVQSGKYEIRTYGFRGAECYYYDSLLKDLYNVEVNIVAGCVVDENLVNHLEGYNYYSTKAINQNFGKDIFEECYLQALIKNGDLSEYKLRVHKKEDSIIENGFFQFIIEYKNWIFLLICFLVLGFFLFKKITINILLKGLILSNLIISILLLVQILFIKVSKFKTLEHIMGVGNFDSLIGYILFITLIFHFLSLGYGISSMIKNQNKGKSIILYSLLPLATFGIFFILLILFPDI